MNQKELRELEGRCIQEEAPTCAARCPIHVDVRKFLTNAEKGSWDEAKRTLAIMMPFPGILGRICDHPCESVCRRGEAGGAIAISRIEKIAVERGVATARRIPLPRKEARVALIGGALSGLTAAWDLAYKGYGVTVFQREERLGGGLGERVTRLAPHEVIEEEMKVLTGLGVEVEPLPETCGREWVYKLMDRFDAVYIGLDSENIPDFDVTIIDPPTLAASGDGFFAGGRDAPESPFSPIGAVGEGRKAAVSIDRFIQKVSLTAAREKEGPYVTRLFTSLEGVESLAGILAEDPERGYSGEEAQKEAGRCLKCECMECVKVCVYLEQFKAYPKQYVRQISNNETIVMGNHGQINRLVNSCSLCGLCKEVCPNDISMAEVCIEGRKSLVIRNKMPPSAHEFALEDMRSAGSDKSAFASHEPGKEKSAFAFFPGCQMGASNPDHVIKAYAYLREHLEGGVGLMARCCGAPAEWAAGQELFEEAQALLATDWEMLGNPVMIVACPTCYKVFKERFPLMEITTLWHMINAEKRAECANLTLAVHDPCATRHEPGIREAARHVLEDLGCALEELKLSGEMTECCGFGGLMAASNPALARDVAKKRASRSETDYVTYCAMCRNSLAASGKKVFHILDLLFGTPAGKAPGLSDRRENRYRLRERLVAELWKGKERAMEEYEGIVLYIDPPVQELMEERRILAEDVQKTIAHAEKSGTGFYDQETDRRLGAFTPAHVTYWVLYGKEADGFRIHNVYCHRMEIVGSRG
jgi:glutamate synthase (NADPH) small chain